MMHPRHDTACCILVSLQLLASVTADLRDILGLQHRAVHLPNRKFSFSDYSEYSDNDETEKASQLSEWNQIPLLNHRERIPKAPTDYNLHFPDALDKNIVWDFNWKPNITFGQITAVSLDPNGNIVIFHRGSRIWGIDTFDNENRFNSEEGPVRENTIVLLDKSGKKIVEWGRNMFYLPHGLTVDSVGNYWITDVALHQVFKFNAKDIEKHVEEIKNPNAMSQTNILKPSLVLGQAFQPGNDETRFCKPTTVAVQLNGDFFVSDGYCNSRIIKYNAKGERILQWGRHWGIDITYAQPPPPNAFFVPHALALSDELDKIFVADRENGRVVAFLASDGTFYKEYKHPSIGSKIYSVAYAQRKIYLVNGPDLYQRNHIHVRGFVLDVYSGDILSQFGPWKDMDGPHDIAVTQTGSEIYVVELNIHKIYRFLQDVNTSVETGNSKTQSLPYHDSTLPTAIGSNNSATGGTTTATLVLSLVTAAVIFIALCVAIAAVVARCQKRGRSFQYDESAVEYSKLVK